MARHTLSLSGDEAVLRALDALLREPIGDDVGRFVLPAGAIEDFGQTIGDRVDLRAHLRFAGAAVIFARDADDAAGIDDIVRRIEDRSG